MGRVWVLCIPSAKKEDGTQQREGRRLVHVGHDRPTRHARRALIKIE